MNFVEFNNYVSKLTEACQLLGNIDSVDINFRENKEYVSIFHINTQNTLYRVNFEVIIEENRMFETKNVENRIYIEQFSPNYEDHQFFDTKEQLLSDVLTKSVTNTLFK